MTHCKRRLATGAILFVGFGIATLSLGWRALWGDEAFAVWASTQPWAQLFQGLDNSPTGYYAALKLARAAFGESVFAIRYGSVLCALVFGALSLRLAGWVLPRAARPAATLLVVAWVALAPLATYYAQEARMYALACALMAGAMLTTTRLATGQGRTAVLWTLYAALSIAAMGVHLYAVAIVAVDAVFLFLLAVRRRVDWRGWATAHAAIVLLYGGWFFGIQSRNVQAAHSEGLLPALPTLLANFGQGWLGLTAGATPDPRLWPVAVALAALIVLGLLRGRALRERRALAAGWMLGALAIATLTSSLVPVFHPRYFLFALLPAGLALALGYDRLPRAGRLVTWLVVLALATSGALTLFDRSWAKSRYDELLTLIRREAQPGDGVILQNSDQIFQYAYYGPLPQEPLVVQNNWSEERIAQAYDAYSANHARIWLLNYGRDAIVTPRPLIERRLASVAVRSKLVSGGDSTLALFERIPAEGGPITPRNDRWADGLTLTGWRWRARNIQPGGTLVFDLLWRADAKPSTDYTLFVHLRRGSEDARVAGSDAAPVSGSRPTGGWQSGEAITDTRSLALPPDLPAGEYRLVIGWYRFPSFERPNLADGSGSEVVLTTLTVP